MSSRVTINPSNIESSQMTEGRVDTLVSLLQDAQDRIDEFTKRLTEAGMSKLVIKRWGVQHDKLDMDWEADRGSGLWEVKLEFFTDDHYFNSCIESLTSKLGRVSYRSLGLAEIERMQPGRYDLLVRLYNKVYRQTTLANQTVEIRYDNHRQFILLPDRGIIEMPVDVALVDGTFATASCDFQIFASDVPLPRQMLPMTKDQLRNLHNGIARLWIEITIDDNGQYLFAGPTEVDVRHEKNWMFMAARHVLPGDSTDLVLDEAMHTFTDEGRIHLTHAYHKDLNVYLYRIPSPF